ncbi:MAG: hypothetical protein DSO09_06460 [Candidatus Methanomethylicota archaeon]|jgi:hypothetical protein|uniref:Uncharacterized protein n=1 Tax=Thermoproteota archaeon TaxID=2056631 RepID=A0A523BB84_9CREN|nr:MAG: hypothetical protein DSO09_06460 [Candidatus Verstraetearchaeota archaeon]
MRAEPLKCGLKADRDIMGALIPLSALQMTDVNPNICGGPLEQRGGQLNKFIRSKIKLFY